MGIAICVVVLLASLYQLFKPGSSPTPTTNPIVAGASHATRPTATTRPPVTSAPPRKGVSVVLRYRAASWTRVTVDGRVVFTGTPNANEQRTFSGAKLVELIIGNAASVQVEVNGKQLGSPGGDGQVWKGTFTPTTGA